MTTICLLLLLFTTIASGVELTFELPDNQKQCFHEEIKKGDESTIDFQVLDGGNYDVDATLEGPNGQILFNGVKKQADTYTWTANEGGIYTLCFSNEFSTFTHKLIYIDFEVGDEKPLPGLENHPQLTKVETNAENIHEHMKTVVDYQTHHRLMEAKGRHYAEELNQRVMYYSIGETIVIFIIALGQVFVLRSFFSDKK